LYGTRNVAALLILLSITPGMT